MPGLLSTATQVTPTPASSGGSTPSVSATSQPAQQASVNATSHIQDLNPKALAANQAKEMLSENGSLMQLARAEGNRAAGARGFGTQSSIAARSSMAEMAKAATPFALQDAQMEEKRQSENLAEVNAMSRFNANSALEVGRNNAMATNDQIMLERDIAGRKSIQAEGYQHDLGRIGAQGNIDIQLSDRDHAQTVTENNQQNNHERTLTQMKVDADAQLEFTRQKYQYVIQNNSNAAQLYSGYQQTIAQIYSNPNMTPSQAEAAKNAAHADLLDGLAMINAVSGPPAPAPGPAGNPGNPNNYNPNPTSPIGGGSPTVQTPRQQAEKAILDMAYYMDPNNPGPAVQQILHIANQHGLTAADLDRMSGSPPGTAQSYIDRYGS